MSQPERTRGLLHFTSIICLRSSLTARAGHIAERPFEPLAGRAQAGLTTCPKWFMKLGGGIDP